MLNHHLPGAATEPPDPLGRAAEPGPVRTGATPAGGPVHLVVGLGGIGRATIARLRRQLARRQRLGLPPLPVRFLAIDLEDAQRARPGGLADFGIESADDTFTLDMASVRDYGNRLQGEVREWLSRYDVACEIGSDAVANPRRLGSLLLAAKAADLHARLESDCRSLLSAHPPGTPLHLHVVGYLAGGIGGGALTQLLSQIRRNRTVAAVSHVITYGLLPNFGDGESDGERQAAAVNTGAALSELARAQPSSSAHVEAGEAQDLGIQRLCDEILVIAPPEDTGHASRDLRLLPEALAIAVRQRMMIGGAMALPDQEEPSHRPIVALGPKLLTTARDEIEDALALSLLQAVLCQMLFANWRHRRGFIPEPGLPDPAEHVRRVDEQSRWLLTADHLIQSAPVLPADRAHLDWRLLTDEWTLMLDKVVELARTRPRRDWFDCVTRLCSQRFAEDFRGVGVPAFYRARQLSRRDIARVVREQVEQDLFGQWVRGERGLKDLHAVLTALIDLQRERLRSVDDRVANIRMAEEACRVRVAAAQQEWSQSLGWGWFRGWFRGKDEVALRGYAVTLQELHVNMTRAEGWLFAKTLLPMVVEELEQFQARLERLLRLVSAGAEEVDFVLDGLSARLEEDGSSGFVTHLFDGERLQRFVQELLADERSQVAHAAALRRWLAGPEGEAGGFHAALGRVEGQGWLNELISACRTEIVGSGGAWSAPVADILKASIHDILEQRCGGDFARLRHLVALYCGHAETLVPDASDGQFANRLFVMLPRSPRTEAFANTVRSAISYSHRQNTRFIDVDDDDGAIHLLVATAPFSISDVELLRQMDWHYRAYVQRDRSYAMLSLHAVGGTGADDGEPMPAVAAPSARVLAMVLIGLPLNIVLERSVDQFGRGSLWLIPKDADGFDDTPVPLADDLLTAPQQIVAGLAGLLEDNVGRALTGFRGDEAVLIEAIVDCVTRIRRRCHDNPVDPVYRAFVEAGKTAAALVRKRRVGGEGHD